MITLSAKEAQLTASVCFMATSDCHFCKSSTEPLRPSRHLQPLIHVVILSAVGFRTNMTFTPPSRALSHLEVGRSTKGVKDTIGRSMGASQKANEAQASSAP
jgi:hypothetical protein